MSSDMAHRTDCRTKRSHVRLLTPAPLLNPQNAALSISKPGKGFFTCQYVGQEEMNPMGRFFTRALATGILFGAILILLPSSPLAAADDTPAFRQADHNLAEALANGDKKAAAALLDERFQWVEANGRIHTKTQVLDDLAQFASDNEGALDVRTVDLLGQVERVLGIHHNQRFAHIW